MIKPVISSLSDFDLVELSKRNDRSATVELINRHKILVFNLAYRLLGNYHVAEEAAQDTFVKAFKSLDSFRFDSKFTTWLYRICFNTCVNYKKGRGFTYTELTNSLNPTTELVIDTNNAEHADRKKYLDIAIRSLESIDATIVTLFYVDETPTSEIAIIVGISEGNVRIRLHRARKKLKEELKKILSTEAVYL
jgi:RNA polymerase sigma-70 factor (ECF subfamily)